MGLRQESANSERALLGLSPTVFDFDVYRGETDKQMVSRTSSR